MAAQAFVPLEVVREYDKVRNSTSTKPHERRAWRRFVEDPQMEALYRAVSDRRALVYMLGVAARIASIDWARARSRRRELVAQISKLCALATPLSEHLFDEKTREELEADMHDRNYMDELGRSIGAMELAASYVQAEFGKDSGRDYEATKLRQLDELTAFWWTFRIQIRLCPTKSAVLDESNLPAAAMAALCACALGRRRVSVDAIYKLRKRAGR